MKVSVQDFNKALAVFEGEVIDTFKTSFQKFIAGAALAASQGRIDAVLAQFSSDGQVDVDAIRRVVEAGMARCGGEFFEVPIDFGLNFGHVDTKITKADIDKFFDTTVPAFATGGTRQ